MKRTKGDGMMNVFITGATSGIGLATAKAFAEKGFDLILTGRREEKLQEVKEEIQREAEGSISTYVLDVTKREEIRDVVERCLDEVGTPDILVNNAGLARGLDRYYKNEEADILEMLHTNVEGLFLLTRAWLPYMVRRNTGHIINLGSTAGLYAYAGAAVYCATKAAIKTFSDGIRIDLMESDLKVTTIQPGIVETPFSETRFHGNKERAAAVYEGIDALQAEDIARMIVFAATQPKHVQITDLVVMATQQGTGFLMSKKKK